MQTFAQNCAIVQSTSQTHRYEKARLRLKESIVAKSVYYMRAPCFGIGGSFESRALGHFALTLHQAK